MWNSLKQLFAYRALIRHMVVLELKSRYRGSMLGFLWTLLNPLLLMLVMWAVFSRYARIKEENYALFILCALMVWQFFSQTATRALNSIISNRNLIQKIYLPKSVFPTAIVSSNVVNLLFSLLAYALIAVCVYRIPITAVLLIPVLLMLYVLTLGVALLLSTLNVFFRDFTHLIPSILRAMFYLTPIFYKPDMFGPFAHMLLRLNPLYYPVVATRDVLYYGHLPAMDIWQMGFVIALIIFVVGMSAFAALEEKFVYYA